MSQWTHACCDNCWFLDHHWVEEIEISIRIPTRLKQPDWEVCCGCGQMTQSGIYVRADPATREFCAHDE